MARTHSKAAAPAAVVKRHSAKSSRAVPATATLEAATRTATTSAAATKRAMTKSSGLQRSAPKVAQADEANSNSTTHASLIRNSERNDAMNEQFTRQAKDMFKVAQDGRIPDNLKAMAEDGVTKTRDAYHKINTVAKHGAKAVEEVVLAAQAGVKAIGDKVMHNTSVNTEAVFDAAQAIARARSMPEAARLQADFMQQQFAAANAQTKELFELSARVAKQTMETMNSVATTSFEQFKR